MTTTRPLALVTGGSSGIGLELAKQFAQHGYDVAISGSSDKVFGAAAALTELGAEAFPFQADAGTYDGHGHGPHGQACCAAHGCQWARAHPCCVLRLCHDADPLRDGLWTVEGLWLFLC
jgi:NAD(P)-dependent dehydrogenase (short-subunit alcohol dehydrogenase family)